MKVVSIDLSLIDFNDLTLFTGYKEDISSIQESIREIGIINPPILMHKGEGYQIITGWKRLISSRKLGHTQALCSVYGSGEISDKECIKIIYQDNRATMSELELAELIMLFRDLCSPDDKELINNVLPLFGIPPSRKHLDKIISLSSLQKEIKDSFYTGGITIEQAQMLSELTPENRVPILLDVILKYRLNNNESRQVIANIEEITLRDQKSAIEVINDLENAMDDNKKGKNELRQHLKRIRYPALSKVEEEYKRQVNNLNLPREVNLIVNQYFEGNDIELRLKVKSPEEFSKILASLEDSLQSGGIE
ncbi:MAG: ParB/RepB/Spo0J family partition protein, partial [Candidatus Dadabacteria bacterium]|nr:ParB/RepB/Spo0J family partition protein [Candidatus Dadabacteria bacterium]